MICEQIHMWFKNNGQCWQAGRIGNEGIVGNNKCVETLKHWNGRLFAMGPTFNWDKGGALHDIEQQEQSEDNEMEIERDQK